MRLARPRCVSHPWGQRHRQHPSGDIVRLPPSREAQGRGQELPPRPPCWALGRGGPRTSTCQKAKGDGSCTSEASVLRKLLPGQLLFHPFEIWFPHREMTA